MANTDDYEDDFDDIIEETNSQAHTGGSEVGSKIRKDDRGLLAKEGHGVAKKEGIDGLEIDAIEANESAVNKRFGSIGGGRSKRRCCVLNCYSLAP